MDPNKVTIEISRADAEKVCTLLGRMNAYDTAAILSHISHDDAQELYDTHKALRRVYYQIRARINP